MTSKHVACMKQQQRVCLCITLLALISKNLPPRALHTTIRFVNELICHSPRKSLLQQTVSQPNRLTRCYDTCSASLYNTEASYDIYMLNWTLQAADRSLLQPKSSSPRTTLTALQVTSLWKTCCSRCGPQGLMWPKLLPQQLTLQTALEC